MMTRSLTLWVIIGLSVALIAGIFGSRTLSKPILQIGNIAQKVGIGDLSVRVDSSVLKYRDEIGDLGRRMNEMIEGLLERFHLTKFVSDETVTAIKKGGDEGIKLGGERKEATVFSLISVDLQPFQKSGTGGCHRNAEYSSECSG